MLFKMDKLDVSILEVLQNEGRITNNALAKKVGLTPTPTLERVKRLEREGIIRGYRAILDEQKLGKSLTLFASVSLKMHQHDVVENFCDAIQDIPEILAAYHISGEGDFLLKILVEDTAAYENLLLKHLTKLPGVEKIQTTVVLSTKKEVTHLSITQSNGEEVSL